MKKSSAALGDGTLGDGPKLIKRWDLKSGPYGKLTNQISASRPALVAAFGLPTVFSGAALDYAKKLSVCRYFTINK
jgi:hypothetical protein